MNITKEVILEDYVYYEIDNGSGFVLLGKDVYNQILKHPKIKELYEEQQKKDK